MILCQWRIEYQHGFALLGTIPDTFCRNEMGRARGGMQEKGAEGGGKEGKARERGEEREVERAEERASESVRERVRERKQTGSWSH
jgi:hypothetical protein